MSFQLPDLLTQTNSFTFRTNKHIKTATDASESWLQSTGNTTTDYGDSPLTDFEKESLRLAKYGLLAGLSCPTCDFPQLRLLTDLVSLVFISHNRVRERTSAAEMEGWLGKSHAPSYDGFELLKLHPLLASMVPRLQRQLSLRPREIQEKWRPQFTQSVQAFANVQCKLHENLANVVPSLPEYISMRREIYAISMFWDVVELLDISPRPRGRDALERQRIRKITQCAIDAVAWAIDIFAYASPVRCDSHNLISLLMKYKNLSVQGAMNYAGGMVKETLEEFRQLEREILPPSQDQGSSSTWSWLKSIPSAIGIGEGSNTTSQRAPRQYLSGIGPIPLGPEVPDISEDDTMFDGNDSKHQERVARYIVALKDYIVGSIHWGYETEIYFGLKGDEIRSFGWVFLNTTAS